MAWSQEHEIGLSLAGASLEIGIQEETIRALSYFTGNAGVRDALIDALQTRRFVGCQRISSLWRHAIYALSAFGDHSTREYLEYWAIHGDEHDRKRAQVALELFGKATFDEVKATVKTKFGIE